MHEQSETIQGRDKRYYNVYGKGTGATQPMPLPKILGFEKKSYPTSEEASNVAGWRSQLGHGQYPTQAPVYGFKQDQPKPAMAVGGKKKGPVQDYNKPSLFDMMHGMGSKDPSPETKVQIEQANTNYPTYYPAQNQLRFTNIPTNAAGITSRGRVVVEDPPYRPGTVPNTIGHEAYHQRLDIHGSPPDLSDDAKQRTFGGMMQRHKLAGRMDQLQPEWGKMTAGPYWGLMPNRDAEEQIANVHGYEGSLPKGTALTDTPVGQQLLPDQKAKDYYYENASYPYGGLWNNQGNHTGAGPKFQGKYPGPIYGFK